MEGYSAPFTAIFLARYSDGKKVYIPSIWQSVESLSRSLINVFSWFSSRYLGNKSYIALSSSMRVCSVALLITKKDGSCLIEIVICFYLEVAKYKIN